jgi:hypothetical protein
VTDEASVQITDEQARPRPPQAPKDPNYFLNQARKLVVANYNENRDPAKTNELTPSGVHVSWFCKTGKDWQAVLKSPIARRIIWEVIYVADSGETYLNVYYRINASKKTARQKETS